jgi:hypothetical protein
MVRPLIDRARLTEAASLGQVPAKSMSRATRNLRNALVRYVELLLRTPEDERHDDRWDLAVFGHRGTIRFTGIHQPWLREATKAWAFDYLPRRRGDGVAGIVQAHIEGIVLLSDSLRLQRADRGQDPAGLGRGDIVAFCNRLAYLQDQDVISAARRRRTYYAVKGLLERMRVLGLTRPGQPLHGLAQEFALTREEMPYEPDDEQPARTCPSRWSGTCAPTWTRWPAPATAAASVPATAPPRSAPRSSC